MRWQKPLIQRCNCAQGWETRRIPPALHVKVSSEWEKNGSRLRGGACACNRGLSDGPVEPGAARSKSKWWVVRRQPPGLDQHWLLWCGWTGRRVYLPLDASKAGGGSKRSRFS